MTHPDLAEALTREHREIDAGIEAFVRALDDGAVDPSPLARAFDALRRHIYVEEELLFPPIRKAGMMMPLLVMTREHGDVWRLMDQLEALLRASDDGTLRSTCQELLTSLDQHNAKEEPIIYPHTSSGLTAAEAAVLAEFIQAGATPDGWVCEAAR